MRLATHYAVSLSHVTETDCAYVMPNTLNSEFKNAEKDFLDLVVGGDTDTEYTLIAIHELEVSVVKQSRGLVEV